jgi:hypothetical protein
MLDLTPVIGDVTISTSVLEQSLFLDLILVRVIWKSGENGLGLVAKYPLPHHQYQVRYPHGRCSSCEPSPFRPCEFQLVNTFHPMANEANIGRGMVMLKPQVPTVKVGREYVLEA